MKSITCSSKRTIVAQFDRGEDLLASLKRCEGEVFIHAHIAVADENQGAAFGGHLIEGAIIYPSLRLLLKSSTP